MGKYLEIGVWLIGELLVIQYGWGMEWQVVRDVAGGVSKAQCVQGLLWLFKSLESILRTMGDHWWVLINGGT